jgi:hypothetical protein
MTTMQADVSPFPPEAVTRRKWRFLLSVRLWMAVYFAIGLWVAGLAWGSVVADHRNGHTGCPVIASLFIHTAASGSPAQGIVVTTLFWPAVVVAGFTATCK